MESHHVLTISPVDHPDSRVQRLGFDLSDPYLEQCWGPVVGPSATLLMRRMSTLWTERVPATIAYVELVRSLGLGGGAGSNSRLLHAIDRTVRFGFATWRDEGSSLDVFLRAPGLERHRVERLPEWTRRRHERLLGTHLGKVAGLDETASKVAAMTARLDRRQRPRTLQANSPTASIGAIGR